MATTKKAARKTSSGKTAARGTAGSSSSRSAAGKSNGRGAVGKANARGTTGKSSSRGAAAKSSSRGAASKSSSRGTAGKSNSRTASKQSTRSRSKASSQITTDHDQIRQWAEQRQGQPACVKGTGARGDTGVLRIDFPGGEEAKLQDISWDDWFQKFDERGLAFLYQDKTANGRTSRFNKLVSRETAAGAGAKTRTAGG
jgi:hypothetical protein